jgi:hypothetical protein
MLGIQDETNQRRDGAEFSFVSNLSYRHPPIEGRLFLIALFSQNHRILKGKQDLPELIWP